MRELKIESEEVRKSVLGLDFGHLAIYQWVTYIDLTL